MRAFVPKHGRQSQSKAAAWSPRDRTPEDIRPSVAPSQFALAFSRIPLHSIMRQPRLSDPVADPDSRGSEQEADRAAERVMQSRSEPDPLVIKPVTANGSAAQAASPGVPAALSASGRPLDPATREFVESRFGHDFGQVRVHTDARAAKSARALGARAFTVGTRVVFDAGQYSPGTDTGKRLLAHELTHVLQQRSTGATGLQRQPQSPSSKRTPPGPGEYTPDEYLAWLKAHPKRDYRIGGPWEPDFLYNRYSPQWFWDHGYVYAGRGGNYPWYWFEVWISDLGSGKEYRAWRTQSNAGKASSKSQPGRGTQKPQTRQPSDPSRIDPNADHEKLFGPVIAEKHNVDAAFGQGDVVLYEDGTVELFLSGSTESYVLRPVVGGLYLVYDPDGKRLDKPWDIPESDIPDPDDDAVP